MSDSPAKIRFNFIKSSLFRVVHADGVYGGLTPRGDLFVGFYAERFPIPTAISHQFDGTKLGPEIKSDREGRSGIVREVEVGVHLDLDVAKAMVDWLQQKIEEAEKSKSEARLANQTTATHAELEEIEKSPEEHIQ